MESMFYTINYVERVYVSYITNLLRVALFKISRANSGGA